MFMTYPYGVGPMNRSASKPSENSSSRDARDKRAISSSLAGLATVIDDSISYKSIGACGANHTGVALGCVGGVLRENGSELHPAFGLNRDVVYCVDLASRSPIKQFHAENVGISVRVARVH